MRIFHELLRFLTCQFLWLSLDDGAAAGGGGGGAGGSGAGAGTGGAGTGTGSGAAAGTGAGGAAAGAGASGAAASGQAGPILDAQGNFIKGWAAQLGGTPELEAKFTSPKALVGSYTNLEKMINAKGIIKPGPNATPEQVDAYYAQLGRPATAAEYALAKPDKLTIDGKQIDVPKELWEAETASKASDLFHKIGLTKEQASALTQFDLERGMRAMGNVSQMREQGRVACETELKKEWGADFDKNRTAAMDAALKAGMTKEQIESDASLGNNPTFLRAMAKVGQMILETPTAAARGNSTGTLTQDPAKEIAAIMADKTHPWQAENAKNNPQAHKDAVAHMAKLYRLKNGEAA